MQLGYFRLPMALVRGAAVGLRRRHGSRKVWPRSRAPDAVLFRHLRDPRQTPYVIGRNYRPQYLPTHLATMLPFTPQLPRRREDLLTLVQGGSRATYSSTSLPGLACSETNPSNPIIQQRNCDHVLFSFDVREGETSFPP
jgi:hypothetical protein